MVKLGASNCRINTHKDNTDLSASPHALPEKLDNWEEGPYEPKASEEPEIRGPLYTEDRTRSSASGFLIPILHTNYK